MPNIVKGFNCLFLFLFLAHNSFGQALIETNNNLNVNGEVYAVEKFPYFGGYYVAAGNFTQVGVSAGYNGLVFFDDDGTHFSKYGLKQGRPAKL